MKKLIALFLILSLALPVTVLAENREPIIGAWYMFFDSDITPEIAANFQWRDKIITVYDFTEDGVIMCLEVDIKEGQGTPLFSVAGKWSKSGDKYDYSLIGLGQGQSYVKDGLLYLGITDGNVYLKLRHMDYFDPYSDYDFGR